MAGAGKKLHGNGARRKARSPAASVSDGGYGMPPHPVCLRAGQKYWPRSARRRRPFILGTVGRDGIVTARRVDGARERVTIAAVRLLQARADGQGGHYQFLGWTPRRYKTWAVVLTTGSPSATLVVPEWHPARPVTFPVRLLPQSAHRPGAWLVVRADLSASTAGRLSVAAMRHCEDPGEQRCPRPTWTPAR